MHRDDYTIKMHDCVPSSNVPEEIQCDAASRWRLIVSPNHCALYSCTRWKLQHTGEVLIMTIVHHQRGCGRDVIVCEERWSTVRLNIVVIEKVTDVNKV